MYAVFIGFGMEVGQKGERNKGEMGDGISCSPVNFSARFLRLATPMPIFLLPPEILV
jgi:hypothetical protein